MRTIIAGSRTINDALELDKAIELSGFKITKIICGGAQGVDRLGEKYAFSHDLPIQYFLPNWQENGKAAGPIRNSDMANNADALILVWDGKSRGSADMLNKANAIGLKVYCHLVIK
jgi:YspA, cpYpsA-related SLOG family